MYQDFLGLIALEEFLLFLSTSSLRQRSANPSDSLRLIQNYPHNPRTRMGVQPPSKKTHPNSNFLCQGIDNSAFTRYNEIYQP